MAFAANFGYSYPTSFRIEGNVITVAKDPACPKVRGDGTFRALNGTVSAGASDNWICATGAFYYQLYPNASKLIGYAIHPDGALEEITSVGIPLPEPAGPDRILSPEAGQGWDHLRTLMLFLDGTAHRAQVFAEAE